MAQRIQDAGAAICLLALFTVCFSRSLAHVAYAAVCAAGIAHLVATGIGGWRRKLPAGSLGSFAFFVLAMLVSACFSGNVRTSLSHLAAIGFMLLIGPFFVLFADNPRFRRWFVPVLVAGMGASVLAMLFRHFFGVEKGTGRSTAFMSVMDFGGVHSLLLPLSLALFMDSLVRGNRKIAAATGATFVAGMCCLLANETRISWVAAAAACAFVFGLNVFRLGRRGFVVMALIAATFLPMLLLNPELVDKAESIYDTRGNESNLKRLTYWSHGWNKFVEKPVFGHGLRSLPDAVLDKQYAIVSYDPKKPLNIHETYLQFLAETGVLGLLGYLGLFLPSLWAALSNLRRGDREQRFWAGALMAFLTVIAIAGLTDYVFNLKVVLYLFGSLCAVCWSHLLRPAPADATAAKSNVSIED